MKKIYIDLKCDLIEKIYIYSKKIVIINKKSDEQPGK